MVNIRNQKVILNVKQSKSALEHSLRRLYGWEFNIFNSDVRKKIQEPNKQTTELKKLRGKEHGEKKYKRRTCVVV